MEEAEKRGLVLAGEGQGGRQRGDRGGMERIQPSRNRGDRFTIGLEHTLGHRLPVKFACGAGDGWRVLWAWLDRAGGEEQRLHGRFAEGQLLVTLGRPNRKSVV